MNRKNCYFSTGALLLAAAAYYLCDGAVLIAILVPVAVHELGHAAALQMLGFRIRGFRAELKGFCMDYYGYSGALGHAVAAAAGPAAGLIYAGAASWAGSTYGSDWLCLSAGISLLLSAFNMLPALPLDGGRIFAELSRAFLGDKRGELLSDAVGLVTAAALLAAGIWMMMDGKGLALAAAATWVLLYQDNAAGIVKKREIL